METCISTPDASECALGEVKEETIEATSPPLPLEKDDEEEEEHSNEDLPVVPAVNFHAGGEKKGVGVDGGSGDNDCDSGNGACVDAADMDHHFSLSLPSPPFSFRSTPPSPTSIINSNSPSSSSSLSSFHSSNAHNNHNNKGSSSSSSSTSDDHNNNGGHSISRTCSLLHSDKAEGKGTIFLQDVKNDSRHSSSCSPRSSASRRMPSPSSSPLFDSLLCLSEVFTPSQPLAHFSPHACLTSSSLTCARRDLPLRPPLSYSCTDKGMEEKTMKEDDEPQKEKGRIPRPPSVSPFASSTFSSPGPPVGSPITGVTEDVEPEGEATLVPETKRVFLPDLAASFSLTRDTLPSSDSPLPLSLSPSPSPSPSPSSSSSSRCCTSCTDSYEDSTTTNNNTRSASLSPVQSIAPRHPRTEEDIQRRRVVEMDIENIKKILAGTGDVDGGGGGRVFIHPSCTPIPPLPGTLNMVPEKGSNEFVVVKRNKMTSNCSKTKEEETTKKMPTKCAADGSGGGRTRTRTATRRHCHNNNNEEGEEEKRQGVEEEEEEENNETEDRDASSVSLTRKNENKSTNHHHPHTVKSSKPRPRRKLCMGNAKGKRKNEKGGQEKEELVEPTKMRIPTRITTTVRSEARHDEMEHREEEKTSPTTPSNMATHHTSALLLATNHRTRAALARGSDGDGIGGRGGERKRKREEERDEPRANRAKPYRMITTAATTSSSSSSAYTRMVTNETSEEERKEREKEENVDEGEKSSEERLSSPPPPPKTRNCPKKMVQPAADAIPATVTRTRTPTDINQHHDAQKEKKGQEQEEEEMHRLGSFEKQRAELLATRTPTPVAASRRAPVTKTAPRSTRRKEIPQREGSGDTEEEKEKEKEERKETGEKEKYASWPHCPPRKANGKNVPEERDPSLPQEKDVKKEKEKEEEEKKHQSGDVKESIDHKHPHSLVVPTGKESENVEEEVQAGNLPRVEPNRKRARKEEAFERTENVLTRRSFAQRCLAQGGSHLSTTTTPPPSCPSSSSSSSLLFPPIKKEKMESSVPAKSPGSLPSSEMHDQADKGRRWNREEREKNSGGGGGEIIKKEHFDNESEEEETEKDKHEKEKEERSGSGAAGQEEEEKEEEEEERVEEEDDNVEDGDEEDEKLGKHGITAIASARKKRKKKRMYPTLGRGKSRPSRSSTLSTGSRATTGKPAAAASPSAVETSVVPLGESKEKMEEQNPQEEQGETKEEEVVIESRKEGKGKASRGKKNFVSFSSSGASGGECEEKGTSPTSPETAWWLSFLCALNDSTPLPLYSRKLRRVRRKVPSSTSGSPSDGSHHSNILLSIFTNTTTPSASIDEDHPIFARHRDLRELHPEYFPVSPLATEEEILHSLIDWKDSPSLMYSSLLWKYAPKEVLSLMLATYPRE